MSGELGYFERRVGTTLCGKWQLERLLGVGGMAAVYEASHAKLGRRDAVKILHPEIAHSVDARQRFEQEARAVNHLRHPGAVEIRDIEVSDDGAPFLVMELLEGESLASALARRGPLPYPEVFAAAAQVLDVLAAAHAVGIIHRDIKPDNLFSLRDGRVKVLDFGVARLRQREGSDPTRTGALIGTVAYMPPEQVSGRSDLDGRADVFAVGATLFRLITGRHLHPTDNDLQLIMQMATEPAPPLRSVAPAVPEPFALVVDRALAYDRDQRYPDAASMRAEILALIGAAPLTAAPITPGPLPTAAPVLLGAQPPQFTGASHPPYTPGLPPSAVPTQTSSVYQAPAPAPGLPPSVVDPSGDRPPTVQTAGQAPFTTPSLGYQPTSYGAATPATAAALAVHTLGASPLPAAVAPAQPSTGTRAAPLLPPVTPGLAAPPGYTPPAGASRLEQIGRRTVAIPYPALIALLVAAGLLASSLGVFFLWRKLTKASGETPDVIVAPVNPGSPMPGGPPGKAKKKKDKDD